MNDRRIGARLIRDALNQTWDALKRRPDPIETVRAAYALAENILTAERCVGDYSTKLRRPSLAVANSTSVPTYYAHDLAGAREALKLLDQLGDDPAERHNDRDRDMLRAALRMDQCDFPALARKFKITMADTDRRIKARCSRIMIGLRCTYPDLFSEDVRVVENRRWAQISDHAQSRAGQLAPVITEIVSAGVTTLNGIARELNVRAIPTTNGNTWSAKQVSRVLKLLTANHQEAALPIAA
jgi:hypothetical protein